MVLLRLAVVILRLTAVILGMCDLVPPEQPTGEVTPLRPKPAEQQNSPAYSNLATLAGGTAERQSKSSAFGLLSKSKTPAPAWLVL